MTSRMSGYIMRRQLWGVLVTLLVISTFDFLVDFIKEAGRVNDDYVIWDALLHSLLSLPYSISELAPAAALIGTIMSMSALSANSELIAFRAVGYSKYALIKPVFLVGILLAALVSLNTEFVAPYASHIAEEVKDGKKAPKQQTGQQAERQTERQVERQTERRAERGHGNKRIWARDKNHFMTAVPLGGGSFRDVAVFEVVDDARLRSVIRAKTAMIENDRMTLHEASVKVFEGDAVGIKETPRMQLPFSSLAFRTKEKSEPKTMTALELYKYIQFLRAGWLNSDAYELELWTHLSHPLSVIVLLLLATPFVLTPTMRAGMGQRLFLGIMLGLACYILNRALSSFALIQQAPAWFAVFFPLVLFVLFGWWRFSRCR